MINGHTTPERSEHFWLGRLAFAVHIAPKHPEVAQDALQAFLRSPVATHGLRKQLGKGTPK